MKQKNLIDKKTINNRHVQLYNSAMDSIEILLDKFGQEIKSFNDNPLELSKNLIATLDFIISAIAKIQKGQRLALDLDKEPALTNNEPQINIIENLDYKKI